MNKKIIGIFFIAAAVVIAASVAYRNSSRRQQTLDYSTTYMLNALWMSYKKNFIDASGGRTIDPERSDITTSEGESYTLLRAVWQDDQPTFDSSWQWTTQNLKQSPDNLFSWLYGKRGDGSYGILTDQGGQNTASDADSDIALALIQASARWQEPQYLAQAKLIINDIWKNEVVSIAGIPYMTSDNLEQNAGGTVLIDPSYLSPYSYRIFAQVDPSHDWNGVLNSSYALINESSSSDLNKTSSANLPPDWVVLDKTTGQLAVQPMSLDTNYGYDALRMPFRLELDYQWNRDQRDKTALENFSFLDGQWQSKQILDSIYGHDGSVVSSMEDPAMYGGSLGYFMQANAQEAAAIYNNKLLDLYDPDSEDFKQALGYYDSNWVWFGMALYNNRLTNFYQATTTPT